MIKRSVTALGLLLLTAAAFCDIQTLQVEPRHNFSVTLESNRMTGYHWELAQPLDPRYLVFINKKYYKPAYKLSQNMGYEIWDLKALTAGDARILLKYVRPWDEDNVPIRTREIRVKIAGLAKTNLPASEASNEELAIMLKERAQAVIQPLLAGDYLTLSEFIHPEKGVRFSPYAGKLSGQDLVFSAQEVSRFLTDKRQYYWGKYGSSGLPIKLTAADYFKTFVRDRDFAKAQQVKYYYISGQSKGLGKLYKGDIVVEFYFPGESLQLVLEKLDEQYFLVGVLHDGRTI